TIRGSPGRSGSTTGAGSRRRRAAARSAAGTATARRTGRASRAGLLHRNPHAVGLGDLGGALVARVHVPDHAHAGVVREYPFDLLCGERRTVRHGHLSTVDGPADADTSAVVDGHPGRAG